MDRTNLAKEYVQPALAAGLIVMTIPDKPRSRKLSVGGQETGVAGASEADAMSLFSRLHNFLKTE